MEVHEAMAEVIGYVDGAAGASADTTLMKSEYRPHYLRGFLQGRTEHIRVGAELDIPEWVNGERGGGDEYEV
jgi:hypothetical protein